MCKIRNGAFWELNPGGKIGVWSQACFLPTHVMVVLYDGNKLRLRLLYLCEDREVSLATSQSCAKGSVAEEMNIRDGAGGPVEGLNLRARVTAWWLHTPLEEARHITCDLTLEVRQGDSSPVSWTWRGQWHQGALPSPPTGTACTRCVPVNLGLSNNLWASYWTSTVSLELHSLIYILTGACAPFLL